MSWVIVKLADICNLQNGYAFKSDDYVAHSNTLNCRMSNIRPGGYFDLKYSPKYLPDDYAIKYSQFLLNDGDVVIAMTDLADSPKILGVPTIVQTNGNYVLLNQRVGKLVIKDSSQVYFPYLQQVLNYPKIRAIYKKFAGGGLQINLGKSDLLSVEIPLPPFKEQKRIAAILDKADAIRRKRQEAIKLADEFLCAVFLDMFTSSKVKKFRKLGEVVKIVGGGTPSKSNSKYWGGSIPWASVKDFTSKVIFTPQDFITEEGLKNSATNLIPKGSIIIPTRMALGKVAITGCDMAINQDLKALFLNHEDIVEVDFLIGFLETKASFIESNGKGATVKGVTLDFLKDIDVPIPEKKEQIRYARIRKKMFEMLSKHDSAVSKNLFDSLSQKVFSIN